MPNSKPPISSASAAMPATALVSTAAKAVPAIAISTAPPTTLRSLPQRSVRRLDRLDDPSSTAPSANVIPARAAVLTSKSSSSHEPNVTNTDWIAADIASIAPTASQPMAGRAKPSCGSAIVDRDGCPATASGAMRAWITTAITAATSPAAA